MPNLRKRNSQLPSSASSSSSSSTCSPLPNSILSRYLALPIPSGKSQVTYVWIDGRSGLRSKSRTLNFTAQRVADIPLWSFDGASTYQTPADPASSDVFLLPVALYNDPFRPGASSAKLVLCETVLEDGRTPTGGNTRAECSTTMLKAASADPWFGIEQGYYLLEGEGASGVSKSQRPLGWPAHGTADAPGMNYCGVGAGNVVGRDVVEAHYRACLYAGVAYAGENAEAMLSQWEFQIGPCRGVAAADDLWMGRYLLYRVAEDFGIGVSLDPKLVPGDGWYGAGAHVNFSTLAMRVSAGNGGSGSGSGGGNMFSSGGIRAIEEAMPLLAASHDSHIAVYDLKGGEDNRRRLTGTRCTAPIETFSWAVDSRHVSVRIPKLVAHNGHGYFEDRRPAANADPYLVCERLVRTVCLNDVE